MDDSTERFSNLGNFMDQNYLKKSLYPDLLSNSDESNILDNDCNSKYDQNEISKTELYVPLHYAKFSLSSDTSSFLTGENKSSQSSLTASDYNNLEDIDNNIKEQYNNNSDLHLSQILGISEDEKCQNRISHGYPKKKQLQSNKVNALEGFNVDKEFEYLNIKQTQRSISLKTTKTPPGTPKKNVRFADALGLDLESIRHILNLDEPPTVPDSATRYLNIFDQNSSFNISSGHQSRHLCVCFSPPGMTNDFLRRVQERKVLLETCLVNDEKSLVFGIIRVMNVNFQKIINIRYTFDSWLTFNDLPATYDSGSNDGATDKFSYILSIPEYFNIVNSLEFSITYIAGDQTYWDNNYGSNYKIQCYMTSHPVYTDDTPSRFRFY